jgi:uncharacterized protein DUF6545
VDLTTASLVAVTATGGAAFAGTSFALVRGGSKAALHLVQGVALLTVAVALQIPPLADLAVAGLPAAWTLQHVAALGAAYLVQSGFARVTEGTPESVDRYLRPRLVGLWAALTVVVAAFVVAPHAPDWLFAAAGRYRTGGPGHPVAALAYLAFGAYLAHAVASLRTTTLHSARLAAATSRKRVAAGMRVHASGEVVVFAFAAHMVAYNGLLLLDVVPPWPESAVDDVLMPLGTGMVLLGFAISTTGGLSQLRAFALRCRYDHHRQQVHPLWTEVAAAMPSAVYGALPAPGGLPPDPSAARHAYRTVVELRDALVLLCQVVPDVPDDDDQVTRAAIIFAAGLPAWRAGARPGHGKPAEPPVPPVTSVLSELRWWAEVAKAARSITAGAPESTG